MLTSQHLFSIIWLDQSYDSSYESVLVYKVQYNICTVP